VLQQAILLHQQGRSAEAESLYRKILAQNPRNADALHLLGALELQRRNLTAAIEYFDRAVEIDPNRAAFFSNRGIALQDMNRFDEALLSYERALAISPENPDVLNNRGSALRALRRFDEALSSYDRALAMRPDYAEAHNNRGNVLRDLKRPGDALGSYDSALAIQPGYADARRNRAATLQDLGRHDEALAGFEAVIVLTPHEASAYRDRGMVQQLLKRRADAIASFEKAIALKPDYAQSYNNLANVLAEEGRLDDAAARYQHALALKPDFLEAHINLAAIFKHQGRLDDAIAHYRNALAIEPRYVEAHLHLGDVYLEQGRPGDALFAAEAAAREQEEPSFPHFALGVLLARCDRKDDARRHLLRHLEQDEADEQGARLILAGLASGPMPDRASDAQMRKLYENRAGRWGEAETYRGHELAVDAVVRLFPGATGLDILDAGCGTGLVGARLRGLARRLEGVDLVPAMLEKAEDTGAYDVLQRGDLVEFLAARPARYDVVVSAATLIHFGDLEPVFRAAASSLRDKGLFVFTLFPNDDGEQNRDVAVAPLGGLGEGGCYVHGRGYVTRLAEENGFSVALMETGVHEYDKRGNPAHGLVVALRRNALP